MFSAADNAIVIGMATELQSLKHAELSEAVLGVFFSVYNELGFGFLETVYRQALTLAFADAGISAVREPELCVVFRGSTIGRFRPDFLVEERIIVEVKATNGISDAHRSQVLNCLRCSAVEIGIIVDFGQRPNFKRLVFDNTRKRLAGC